jgi:hypothetical protein
LVIASQDLFQMFVLSKISTIRIVDEITQPQTNSLKLNLQEIQMRKIMPVDLRQNLTDNPMKLTQGCKFMQDKIKKSLKLFSILSVIVISSGTPVMAAELSEHCQVNESLGPMTRFALAIRTTNKQKEEVQPTYGDCNAVVNELKGAGYIVKDWKCEPRWGTCPEGGYGSCILAEFYASPVPVNPVSAVFGGEKIGKLMNDKFGPTRCDMKMPKSNGGAQPSSPAKPPK